MEAVAKGGNMVKILRYVFLLLGVLVAGGSGDAKATVVTFDGGTLVTNSSTLSTYTENGLQFQIFGTAPAFVTNGAGHALEINLNNDIIITRVGGGTFSLDSFDFLGGGDTLFGGFHGDFICGGENSLACQNSRPAGADISFALTGLATTEHPASDNSAWQNVDTIDWCGYCISGFDPNNAIDNLTFSIPESVPEPTSIALFLVGLLGLGSIRYRSHKLIA